MLFKFKSKAAADLIMLEADARRLLQIMIGADPVKGILPVHLLPDVLAKLDVAVQQDEAMRLARSQNAQQAETRASEEEPEPALPAIRLAQRAAPMQQMIQRSIREESDIVWGV